MAEFYIPSLSQMKKLIKTNSYFRINKYWTNYGDRYWLNQDSSDKPRKAKTVGKFGIQESSVYDCHKARPYLTYSDIKDKCSNVRTIDGSTAVDYGEYIGTQETDEKIIKRLNDFYESNNLLLTGKKYYITEVELKLSISFFNRFFSPEYYYGNQKYVYCESFYSPKAGIESTHKNRWYKVEPITWIVDEAENIAVARNPIILSNNLNNINEYLNSEFNSDIIPSDLSSMLKTNPNSNNTPIKNLLYQINEWIYILETDTHNVKYENHLSNKLISLKKVLKSTPNYNFILDKLSNVMETYINKLNNKSIENDCPDEAIEVEIEQYVSDFIDGLSNSINDKTLANKLVAINYDIYEDDYEQPKTEFKTKSEKIQFIVDKIKELSQYRKNYRDIKNKIEKLISEYNDKITKASEGLTLDYIDQDLIYSTLIDEFNAILNEQKSYTLSMKKYYRMLDLINEWEDILNGKEIKTPSNDLSKNFETLRMVVFPYLASKKTEIELNDDKNTDIGYKWSDIIDKELFEINNDDMRADISFQNKLLEILEKEKEKINEFIQSEYEDGYRSISEFEQAIRLKYQGIILAISNEVSKMDFISNFKATYNALLDEKIIDSNNKYIQKLLELLNDITKYVKINGSQEDRKKLNSILASSIDYNQDINSILNEIKNRYIEAYKIQLDIIERSTKRDNTNSNVINVEL